MLEYQGKRVNPYFVLEQLDNDIELQEIILSEKGRELYEEIIMNSVGRIIRGRINRAELWVRQIDQLMSQWDSSSGLTFSLPKGCIRDIRNNSDCGVMEQQIMKNVLRR
jgi:hypothetical protein